MRPGAILDLREIGLAQTAADLALHGGGQFLLSHRTAPATERAFDGAEGAEFVAKFHGSLPVITICKVYIAICNLSSEIGTHPLSSCISLNLNELLNWPCKEGRRKLACVANQIYSGFLSDCRSIPSCWHFLYR